MSLKRQLFLASLLMLLIPWAGLTFVLELDSALRQQTLQQLNAQGQRMAELAEDRLLGQPAVTKETVIYALPANTGSEAFVWPDYDDQAAPPRWHSSATVSGPGQPRLQWQARADERYLYLLAEVQDHQLTAFNPARPDQPYHRFELLLQAPANDVERANDRQRWFIRPDDRRAIPASEPGRWDYRVHASWRIQANRWQVEIRMPLPAEGSRLGFQLADTGQQTALASTGTDPLPALIYRKRPLERVLARQLSPGQQVTVAEPAGWISARSEKAYPEPPGFDRLSPGQILETMTLNGLRALIRLYQPAPDALLSSSEQMTSPQLPDNGLVRHPDGSLWLATAHSLYSGRTLILEQSLEQLLSVSGSALGTVLARSLLIILALTLVLLGYASWLSWRITRLQRLVSASVDDDGRILASVPPTRSRDELGQLQRHFSQMVERLQNYHHYLENFSRRLSHELKTPVAVVRSSLENLAHSGSEQEHRQYLERASTATERLRRILNSMSEAARLEQSFDQADMEPFDLAEVVREASAAYQSLDSTHQIRYDGPEHGCPITGNPEMLVQLLDKLVDNARDFTPNQGRIDIRLQQQAEHYHLDVFNEGSALPQSAGVDIFGAFVSQREGKAEGHLGQGLLIARLIADFHGGKVEAFNQHQGGIDGVCFRVIIPLQSVFSRNTP